MLSTSIWFAILTFWKLAQSATVVNVKTAWYGSISLGSGIQFREKPDTPNIQWARKKHIFLRDSNVCPRCIFIFNSDQAQINNAHSYGLCTLIWPLYTLTTSTHSYGFYTLLRPLHTLTASLHSYSLCILLRPLHTLLALPLHTLAYTIHSQPLLALTQSLLTLSQSLLASSRLLPCYHGFYCNSSGPCKHSHGL